MVQGCQIFAELPFGAFGRLLNVQSAFLQLKTDRHGGGMLFFQFVAKAGELVDPGFDAEHITALALDPKLALPAVVAQVGHDLALPDLIALGPPAHPHGQLVVTVGEHLAGHHHVLADHGLDRKLPAFEGRQGIFNHDSRQ
ncbi:hypothetical protein D3C72_1596420 [compost metagenome]